MNETKADVVKNTRALSTSILCEVKKNKKKVASIRVDRPDTSSPMSVLIPKKTTARVPRLNTTDASLPIPSGWVPRI